MANSIIGSIEKIEIGVEGLNGVNLSDENVSLTTEFYTQGSKAKGSVVIAKGGENPEGSALVADEADPNKYIAVVPTETLFAGDLVCDITVSYTDAETSTIVKASRTAKTGIKLIQTI